jgi:hypothetical protein
MSQNEAIKIYETYHLSNFGKRMTGCPVCEESHNLIDCPIIQSIKTIDLCRGCGKNKFNTDAHINCEKIIKSL